MRDFFARLGIWGELVMFLWRRKLYWLVPMIVVLALVAVLLILSSNPVTGPFIYSLW
ncbi:MAG: hypothetical protein IAE80_13375 [Anaerolinea sp.]|nr:hypothetical protein [Anaerolinea sp.]